VGGREGSGRPILRGCGGPARSRDPTHLPQVTPSLWTSARI